MALNLLSAGHRVTVWCSSPERAQALARERGREDLLPGVRLPDSVAVTARCDAAADADIVVLAVPSGAARSVSARFAPYCAGKYVVNLAKGFDPKGSCRLSAVFAETLPLSRIVVLSGPSHAEEVARGAPTLCVVASREISDAEYIRNSFSTPVFRLYSSGDVAGVELGGAIKNIMAIVAGVVDGMALGDNTRAALMTRGIAEMTRLGMTFGGQAETFAGLSGIGDLIVTCTSPHSRNHEAGFYIGQGFPVAEALKKVGKTVEGYEATRIVYEVARNRGVEMPIVAGAYDVLFGGKSPRAMVSTLMNREPKHEFL
jgi:glycerol-3-phosphate dehydrogenase (NAD(P)+)